MFRPLGTSAGSGLVLDRQRQHGRYPQKTAGHAGLLKDRWLLQESSAQVRPPPADRRQVSIPRLGYYTRGGRWREQMRHDIRFWKERVLGRVERLTLASPGRRWIVDWLLAAATVYAPFAVAAAHTWLFVNCTRCKMIWLRSLWVAPGAMLMELVSRASNGMPIPVSPPIGFAIAAMLSALLVAVVAWLSGRGRLVRWISLTLVVAISGLGALAAFAMVRA
jgi:hypothetical protein